MSAITNLEPRIVWEQFDAITRVPRPSKKEGRIIEFLVDFARKHNLEYKKDAIGNVVMRKPATPGFENRPTVILQSHMDMVCEKNSDVEFDFDRDPIRTRIDGGWVRAEGTTLGADCGIGMAAALAVLLDESVEHGPVEALGQLQRLPLRATEAEVFHKKKNVYSGHSSGAPVSRCRKTRRAFPLPLGRGMRDMTGKEYFSCKITQLLVAYRQKRPKRQGLSPRTASRPALPKRPPLE